MRVSVPAYDCDLVYIRGECRRSRGWFLSSFFLEVYLRRFPSSHSSQSSSSSSFSSISLLHHWRYHRHNQSCHTATPIKPLPSGTSSALSTRQVSTSLPTILTPTLLPARHLRRFLATASALSQAPGSARLDSVVAGQTTSIGRGAVVHSVATVHEADTGAREEAMADMVAAASTLPVQDTVAMDRIRHLVVQTSSTSTNMSTSMSMSTSTNM